MTEGKLSLCYPWGEGGHAPFPTAFSFSPKCPLLYGVFKITFFSLLWCCLVHAAKSMKPKELERRMGAFIFSLPKDDCAHLQSQRKVNSDKKKQRPPAFSGTWWTSAFLGRMVVELGFWTFHMLGNMCGNGCALSLESKETFSGQWWQGCCWGRLIGWEWKERKRS